jgi:hypothetical protein
MDQIILQQIESLELILNSQQRRLDIAINELKQLAKIESNFITFGSLSNQDQLDKEIIIEKYLYERD